MARTIPTSEPSEAHAGSPWLWDASYADFPADESWELAYYLRGAKDLDFTFGSEVTAASSGPGFEVRIPKATTDDLGDYLGKYRLIGRVSKSGDDWDGAVVYNRHLLVLADPSTAVGAKSWNRQMLDAIRAALKDGISDSTSAKSISINGRSVEYRSVEELTRLESQFAIRVAMEENPGQTVVREAEFVRPGHASGFTPW